MVFYFFLWKVLENLYVIIKGVGDLGSMLVVCLLRKELIICWLG